MARKSLLRKIGRIFLKLEHQPTGILNFKVLVVDSQYSEIGQLFSCVNNLRNSLSNVEITILTYPKRYELIKESLSDVEIVVVKGKFIPKRLQAGFKLIFLNRKRFDFIVLLSLDLIMTLACILFVRRRTYVYHPEHKWSLLRRKTLNEYLVYIPIFILNIFIFIYLLISVIFIYLNRPIRFKCAKES